MKMIVEKYGGTSVRSIDKIKQIAGRIVQNYSENTRVVVVVSAMGQTTDELESLASAISPQPNHREISMLLSTGEIVSSSLLAMALQAHGKRAISLTGAQSGIYTDSVYTNAKILHIKTDKIMHHLQQNEIVVVAGYQGVFGDDITVLGRGGSDATAVALACALKADICEIFTDVNGVYTADPNLIPDASLLEGISYEEMIEMAGAGSQVMMGRAVEIARKYDMKIRVSSSHDKNSGTLITRESELEKVVITGISTNENIAKIDIFGSQDNPNIISEILGEISDQRINIIIMNLHETNDGRFILSFIVRPEDASHIEAMLKIYCGDKKIESYNINKNVAQISLIGSGIANNYGVAHKVFQTLAENSIPTLMTSTSEIKIALIVNRADAKRGTELLHRNFALNNLNRKIVGGIHG